MNLAINYFELNEFYNRWKKKADNYNNDTLDNYFDRFFTLYVIYNRIYNLVTVILAEQGELCTLKEMGKIKSIKKTNENEAATICITHFLRADLENLIYENQKQIDDFKIIIKDRLFNIDLKNGKPQRSNDLELKKGLESNENIIVFESLLKIIYNLRCNIFHADKGFYEFQKLILEPANICLNNVVMKLFEKLNPV